MAQAKQHDKYALRGAIIHSSSIGFLDIIEDGLLIYDMDGTIESLVNLNEVPCDFLNNLSIPTTDYANKIIIPGFIDAHTHAPQYVFTGIVSFCLIN